MKKLLCAFALFMSLPVITYAGQWYVFADGGYSFLSSKGHKDSLPSTATTVGQQVTVVETQNEVFQTVSDVSTGNFGAGFGYEFPFGNGRGILASNDAEFFISHVSSVNNTGLRTEYATGTSFIEGGQTTVVPNNPALLNQTEPYSYQTSSTRLLVNYVLNFKPFIAHFASFIELGAGLNVASFGHFNQIDTANTATAGVDKVDFADRSKMNFAYNAGLGLSYQFTDHWSTRVGYRYTNGGMSESGAISQATGLGAGSTVAMTGHISNPTAANEVYLRALYYF